MVSPLLLAILVPAARAACGDVPTLVEAAERAAIEGRLDATKVALDDLQAAFGCSPVADPALLARSWLADGARAAKAGDARFAGIAFASAARVSPSTWTDAYGPELRAMYEAARQMVQGQGQVRISPVPAGYVAAIDGVVVSPPAPASEGLHLVQVGPAAEPMAFASVFHLPPGDTFFVLTGMETTPPAVAAPAAPVAPKPASQAAAPAEPPGAARLPAAPRRDRPGWLIPSSAAAAALAVTSALLAVRQDAAMEDATTLDNLDTAYDRQRGWAWTSYGSMGLTVVSIGLYFAL